MSIGLVAFLALIGIAATPARAQATWTDPATALMWAGQDNGADINWSQAKSYCANLQLGGYSNWRLPNIYELATIYNPPPADGLDVSGHVKGKIHYNICVAWWVWSSSAGEGPGEMEYFNFTMGVKSSGYVASGIGMRALCVRGA
jgi:hypothetical protein